MTHNGEKANRVRYALAAPFKANPAGTPGPQKILMAFEFVGFDELAEGSFLRFAQPIAFHQGTGPVQNASRIQKRRQGILVQVVSGLAIYLKHGVMEVLYHKFFQQNR